MAYTDINSEDRLVQKTFAEHLQTMLGWESIYAWNDGTIGPDGTPGRADTREVVLTRDLLLPRLMSGRLRFNARPKTSPKH
jgi:type I restriction enzyme R subunit